MIKTNFWTKYKIEDFSIITPEVARFLNNRLEDWAEWFLRHCDSGIGFRTENE